MKLIRRPPHMIGLCKLRETKLDNIFFLFLHVGVDEFFPAAE